MTTHYHVAGNGWNPGEDLYCFDWLDDHGYAPTWKWEGEPIDTDVVCLFESIDEATDMQAEYGGTIVSVDVPDGERLTRVGEGYPAIYGRIPGEWLSVVETVAA